MKDIYNIIISIFKLIRVPIMGLLILGALGGIFSLSSFWLIFNNQVPVEIPENNFEFIESSPSFVYDIEGNQIASFRSFDLYEPIVYEDLTDVVIGAVVSNEDQSFFEHNGADIRGILRAGVSNLQSNGGGRQGGSTITQQVARGFYLSPEQTYERKAREILLAIQIEEVLTKEEILESYLNLAYFGEGAYGISAAAEIYFRKEIDELTASEAASLIASIPAPAIRNPRVSPEFNDEMRIIILGKMLSNGYIDQEEYDNNVNDTVVVLDYIPSFRDENLTNVLPPPRTDHGDYPFFVDSAIREISNVIDEDLLSRGGLEIHTTLVPEEQQLAIDKSREFITGGGSEGVTSSIVTIDNETGFVVAAVGGPDWDTSQVNLSLGGSLGFQPGSTLKPFLYLLSLENGLSPNSVIPAPATWIIPDCNDTAEACSIRGGARTETITEVITNEEGEEVEAITTLNPGSSTLNTALKFSYNTPWAIQAHELGTDNFAEFLQGIGVDIRESNYYSPTIALGAFEVSPLGLATGYYTLAREGSYLEPTFVTEVWEGDELLLSSQDRVIEQKFNEDYARWTAEAMFLVTESGTGTRAALPGGRVAGKTGTTTSNRAAWFAGFTPEYTSVVWVGNPDIPQSLSNIGGFGSISGGNLPATIWRSYMGEFLEGESWSFRPLPEFPDNLNISDDVAEIFEDDNEEELSDLVPIIEQRVISQITEDCLFDCQILLD